MTNQPPTVRRATSILNKGLGPHPSVLVPSVVTPSGLDAATVTSMFRDQATGVLWLKITSTDMIRLEDDGMGQAIMVDF